MATQQISMTENPTAAVSIGPFDLFPIETGRFRLDAGAMLGVVPKTIWSRQVETDEKNRILMASRSLLIRSRNTNRIYLVDNGSGDKFDEKMAGIYGIDYDHSHLLRSLAACGVAPEQVTDLIFTHLHFDHCGGTTFFDEHGELQHQFPHATYHVTEKQMQSALQPNQRERASYLNENIEPIATSERLNRVGEQHEWEEGLSALQVFGHTLGMQLPVIQAEGKTLVFCADLIPTRHHIPLVWVMGYDMDARQTLLEKERFLQEAVENRWYLFLQHDPEVEVVTVNEEKGRYRLDKELSISQL